MVQEWNPNFEEENGSVVVLERMEPVFLDLEAKDAHFDLGNLFRYIYKEFVPTWRDRIMIRVSFINTPPNFPHFSIFFLLAPKKKLIN